MKPEHMGWQHWQNVECQRLGITLIQHDQIVKICQAEIDSGHPSSYEAICAALVRMGKATAGDLEIVSAKLRGEQDRGEED